MLSADDAELARSDSELEGLRILLDPELLSAELAEIGLNSIREIVPCYVRYKPRTSCLVAYHAEIDGQAVDLHATTWAKALDAKSEKARLRMARGEPALDGRASGRSFSLDRARALVTIFPGDLDLPVLSKLGDPAQRAKLLARIFREDPEAPINAVTPLAYKPGRRFVGRVDWSGGRAAVVRFHASAERGRRVRLPVGLRDGDGLRIARRVGGSKRHRAVAFEWIAGDNLREKLREDPQSIRALAAPVSRALREFHATPIGPGDRLASRLPADGLREIEREIAWLVPGCARRVAEIRARLESRLARVDLATCLVHGDLYDKQIVLTEDGVGLIDLDEISLGDPRQDLGLMLAHWERDRCFGTLNDPDGRLDQEFVAAYGAEAGVRLDDLSVFVAAALFRLAQHPFRARLPEWSVRIGQLLERIEQRISIS